MILNVIKQEWVKMLLKIKKIDAYKILEVV